MNNFKRGQEPYKKLLIGTNAFFGFNRKFLDLTYNDGKKTLYISKDFGSKILNGTRFYKLKNDIIGTYSKDKYSCKFHFILINLNGSDVFMTCGLSGDYGFNVNVNTKNTFGSRIKKTLYNQLYNHLITLI